MWLNRTFIVLLIHSFVIIVADRDEGQETTTPSLKENEPKIKHVSVGGRITAELNQCQINVGVKTCSADLKQPAKGDKGENGGKGNPGLKGDKGDKSEKGNQGEKGKEGEKGWQGITGKVGNRGDLGEKGEQGLKGVKGDQGDKAEKGDKGQRGDKGEIGNQGTPGSKGEEGKKGLQGPKGEPGVNRGESITGPDDINSSKGSYSNPAVSCMEIDQKDDGKYTLYPSEKFDVFCVFTENRVCLQANFPPKTYDLDVSGTSVLLSKFGFDVKDFYGISLEQLGFLNSWTMGGTQKIKIYCDGIFADDNSPEKSIQLLLWNDNLIGPEPAPHTPVFYEVTKSCTSEEEYMEIEISSTTNTRLPVVDFLINNTHTQGSIWSLIHMELVELCLNFSLPE